LPPSGSQSFTFQLRTGASTTQAGTTLETQTASASNSPTPGTFTFSTLLTPGATYNLCEVVMPGWMTTLGPPFYTVYNPSGDNSTVCTDFSVSPAETKVFTINNTPPPGGLARTIGFWKNWSSCTGGGQPIYKLDQVLGLADITIGILVLHDSDTRPNYASDCADAVDLLNKSTITSCKPPNKKMSSDPAFNLAAQLLAADLNVNAGAGQNGCVVDAINAAQALLAAIHFDGCKHDNMTAAQVTKANCLATKLDVYNNTTTCTGSCP
jgi:hypothetical protein